MTAAATGRATPRRKAHTSAWCDLLRHRTTPYQGRDTIIQGLRRAGKEVLTDRPVGAVVVVVGAAELRPKAGATTLNSARPNRLLIGFSCSGQPPGLRLVARPGG